MRQADRNKWPALRMEIWEERDHVSELTGKPLFPYGHFLWKNQFLHVLPHGKYASEALNKRNIMLGLPEEHDKQNEFPAFNDRRDELQREHNKKSIYSYGKFD